MDLHCKRKSIKKADKAFKENLPKCSRDKSSRFEDMFETRNYYSAASTY